MTIKDQLLDKLNRTTDMPFLFVGSGLSRRYLGLETWGDLLRRFADQSQVQFDYYRSTTDSNWPRIATLLAADYHEAWWKMPKFAQRREALKARVTRRDSALKFDIANYIADMTNNPIDADLLDEISVLGRIEVDGVITTNWDRFLENRFPQFEVYVGQDSLLFAQPQSIAEIYKIHGCCSDPHSMVLTEEDYAGFNKRNAYLAAKLLTVFVEHPVFFFGYSISDPHILDILRAIAECLTKDHLTRLSDRLFFVEYDRANEGDALFVRVIGESLPLTVVRTKNFKSIYEALAQKKRYIPAKILRKVKAQLYELVRTNDPLVQRYVQSFEDIDKNRGVDVYAGVGPLNGSDNSVGRTGHRGYIPIKMPHLIRDVVFDEDGLDANELLLATLPELAHSNARWFPIFKYLKKTGRIEPSGIVTENLSPGVVKRALRVADADYFPTDRYALKKKADVVSKGGSVTGVRRLYGDERAISYISMLPAKQVDIKDLESLLREKHDEAMGNRTTMLHSDYKRLVCFYDWLRYGPRP